MAKQLNMAEDVKKYLENRVESDSEEEDYEMLPQKTKPKWDCETICSTYSNLYNRPKVRNKFESPFLRQFFPTQNEFFTSVNFLTTAEVESDLLGSKPGHKKLH